jgi:C4-dicarboxylate-specific signal transduction histidine kinase
MNANNHPHFVPELERSSLLGELARSVFHDCNDFLNNLLLQLVLIEEAVPASAQADLAQLKRSAKRIASKIHECQQFRRSEAQALSTNLDDAVADSVHEVECDRAGSADAITVRLSAVPASVHCPPGALRRLCFFLLRDALNAAEKVEITSERSGSDAHLQIDDNRRGVADAELSEWFQSQESSPHSRSPLEIAACVSIANRCGATIQAGRSALGGVRVDIAFPTQH